jgi:hypothetical protein
LEKILAHFRDLIQQMRATHLWGEFVVPPKAGLSSFNFPGLDSSSRSPDQLS